MDMASGASGELDSGPLGLWHLVENMLHEPLVSWAPCALLKRGAGVGEQHPFFLPRPPFLKAQCPGLSHASCSSGCFLLSEPQTSRGGRAPVSLSLLSWLEEGPQGMPWPWVMQSQDQTPVLCLSLKSLRC